MAAICSVDANMSAAAATGKVAASSNPTMCISDYDLKEIKPLIRRQEVQHQHFHPDNCQYRLHGQNCNHILLSDHVYTFDFFLIRDPVGHVDPWIESFVEKLLHLVRGHFLTNSPDYHYDSHDCLSYPVIVVVLSDKSFLSEETMNQLVQVHEQRELIRRNITILPLYYDLSPSDLQDGLDLKRWHKAWSNDFDIYEQSLFQLLSFPSLQFHSQVDNELDYLKTVLSTLDKMIHPSDRCYNFCGKILEDSPRQIEETIKVTLKQGNQSASIILVQVVYFQAFCLEKLCFLFHSKEEMASCVGVACGPDGPYIAHLNADLSVSTRCICNENDEHGEQTLSFMKESSVATMDPTQPTRATKRDDCRSVVVDAAQMSRRYGIGVAGVGQLYIHEMSNTEARNEMIVPLLYDIALFMLRHISCRYRNCNDETRAEGAACKREIKVDPEKGNMMKRLSKACNGGQGNGGGSDKDGDEERTTPPSAVLQAEDEDSIEQLTVIVYPRPKEDYILSPQGHRSRPASQYLGMPAYHKGLLATSVGPKMVFTFRKSHGQRSEISIKVASLIQLETSCDVLRNPKQFGWYHNDINIEVDWNSNGALLDPESGRLWGSKSSALASGAAIHKFTNTKSKAVSKGGCATLGIDAKFVQATISGNMQAGTNKGQSTETSIESVCDGFFYRNHSGINRPLKFVLSYDLGDDVLRMIKEKARFQHQGLFSTINPCIEGILVPIDNSPSSPYTFTIHREMKLHEMVEPSKLYSKWLGSTTTFDDLVCSQEYIVHFYLNHAMSHLRSHDANHDLEIWQKNDELVEITNVIMVDTTPNVVDRAT